MELKEYGELLEGKEQKVMSEKVKDVEPKEVKDQELTKEEYLTYKKNDLTDKEIRDKVGIDHNKLHSLKKKWDLIGKFGPAKPKPVKVAPSEEKREIQPDKKPINQYEPLKHENEKLKTTVDALLQERLRMLETVSNLERELTTYQNRVNELVRYKTKYDATKEALKVHLE